jgi:hypothetical protein
MKMTIDRMEGTVAVLLSREDESVRMNIPVSLLPPSCREGDILTIRIERDPETSESVKNRILDRIQKLKKRE